MFGPMQALRLEHGLAREDSHLLALHSPQSVPSASPLSHFDDTPHLVPLIFFVSCSMHNTAEV